VLSFGSRRGLRIAFLCALVPARSALAQGVATPVADSPAQPPVSAGPHALTPPSPLHRVQPAYPEGPAAGGVEGDVVLALSISAAGVVDHADVVDSKGPVLDTAAVNAAKQWTFAPATRGGHPIESHIHIRFHFEAPTPPPPPPPISAVPPTAVSVAPAPSAPAPGAAAAASVTEQPTEVVVAGHIQPRSRGTSDYQITVGQLAAVPRSNASDALKLAPGFLLTNEGGSGHAEQVFLRGFDAHEGQDLEFTVDGVPINDAGNYHGNGYADTHFIIPELIHSVRVLEGPYAPQQGNFAVAGSADYQLGLDKRGLTTEFTTGNFNTQRLLLLWGPNDAPSGTFAGAEFYTTDGYGTNRQAKRGTAIGQYELRLGEKSTLRVNATAYFTEYNSAGIVRNDDVARGTVGFYGTEDPNQTGNTASRASVSATYESRFQDIDISQQFFVIDRTMRLLENDTGFIEDTQRANETLHGQRGDLIDLQFSEVTLGGRGLARWHGTAFGQKQEFEGGYYARLDQTTSQQYRILAGGTDTPYRTDADYTSTLGDLGVYVDGNVHFARWLALRGGVRADAFLFNVLNNCAVTQVGNPNSSIPDVDLPCQSQSPSGVYREPFQRTATASGAIMPRGSIVVGPFEHFEFTASVGKGVRSVDPSDIAQGLATPFISVTSEDLGVAYTHDLTDTLGLTAKSAFFNTHVGQDLIFDPTAGRSTLSSGSSRTGWSGSMRLLGSFLDIAANATLVRAVFDDSGPCAPYCGLLVPYVPDLVLRADAAYFHNLPWKLDTKAIRATIAYGVSYVGRRPLPYGDVSDITFVSDASVGLGWSVWNVRLSGQNLFDSQYKLGEYNYASSFCTPGSGCAGRPTEPTLAPERSFTAGAPRQIMLSLSATLGGA
jgi:iron complex outermembrane receptor protein